MSFDSRPGLNPMTRPQDGRQRPAFRRPGASVREGEALRCDVTGVAADAVAVDVLARLALALRQRGERLELCGASEELRALVAFMGLAEVLLNAEAPPGVRPGPAAPALRGQRRKVEQREEGVGREEEGELDDLPA